MASFVPINCSGFVRAQRKALPPPDERTAAVLCQPAAWAADIGNVVPYIIVLFP